MKIITILFFILICSEVKPQELVRTLEGHSDRVYSVSFSPDGKWIASGSADKTVRIWDASNPEISRVLYGHSDRVSSICYSPDGKQLVSSSIDKLKIWDINSAKLIREIEGSFERILSVTYSPDGKYIASGGSNKTIRIWDASNGRLIRTLVGHDSSILTVAFSPDGEYLASCSNDNTIKIWDVSKGILFATLQKGTSNINSITYDALGKLIAGAYVDKTIKIWDVSNNTLINTLENNSSVALSLSFSPNGNLLASANTENSISIWNVSKSSYSNADLRTNINNEPVSQLPPILIIEDINFSTGLLSANEKGKLNITIKNIGPGNAENVSVELTSDNNLLSYQKKTDIKIIKANGDKVTVSIDVSALRKINTGESYLDINVTEPNFRVKVQGKRIIFATREFMRPDLVIAKFAVLEYFSSSPNNQIDLNEMIDLKFAIQNIGEGAAEDIRIKATNNQNGLMLLGIEENGVLNRKNEVTISRLESGSYQTITYRYFINSDFTEKQIKFSILCSEKYGDYGISESKSVDINTTLKEEGVIRQVTVKDNDNKTKPVIENIPDFTIDIRENIPVSADINHDAVAVIIGNKDYRVKDIPSVENAIDDARIMKQYIIKTFGYKEGNIIYLNNAAQGDFNSIFGTEKNYKGKLYNYVKEGKSDVFIFYSGHGAPDPETKQGYFVPVDCDPSTVALNGYPIKAFYDNLAKINYKSLTVVIDACFSGASDKGMLLKNISPVFINVENPMMAKENTVVFTSAGGDQVSSWYPEKKHSLFTYYFLKALQGDGDLDKDKKLTVGEIKEYVNENVPYMARRLNNREQTPQVIGDENKVILEY